MNTLGFSCYWSVKKERTWSGIPYSLSKELCKDYNIKNIELNNFISFFGKLLIKIGIKNNIDMELISKVRKNQNKVLKSNDLSENDIIVQFAEIFNSKNTYIYIDMCVDYIKSLYDSDKDLYNISGFQKYNIDYLTKRNEIQNYYLKNNAKGIFTMSNWLAKYIIDKNLANPEKVYPVGGGINIDVSKLDTSKKTGNKLLFIGRDFTRKGGDLVISAFKLLINEHPNVELHLAGPKIDPVNEKIENYYFYGDIDYSKTTELFNLCDVFVMPSYFEAYGLVFIEALTFGLPCIGRNCFEMPYIIENKKSGLLIENDDSIVLKNYMKELLFNDSYKNYVNNNFNNYINNYTWKKVEKKINSVINKDR